MRQISINTQHYTNATANLFISHMYRSHRNAVYSDHFVLLDSTLWQAIYHRVVKAKVFFTVLAGCHEGHPSKIIKDFVGKLLGLTWPHLWLRCNIKQIKYAMEVVQSDHIQFYHTLYNVYIITTYTHTHTCMIPP